MKFSIKDFTSKCGQIRSFLRIWSHLLKKSLIEKFIFVQCYADVYLLIILKYSNNFIFLIVQGITAFQQEFNIWKIGVVQYIDRNDDTIELRILV